MGKKFSRELLESLTYNVFLPIRKEILNDGYSEEYIYQKDLGFFKMAILPFKKNKDQQLIQDKIDTIKYLHKNLPFNMSDDNLQKYVELFFKYYRNWIDSNDIEGFDIHILETMESQFIGDSKLESEESDDFFCFDSEEIEDAINDMHYLDKEKIDAKQFIEESNIDKELIEDLKELILNFNDSTVFRMTLDKEYLNDLSKIIFKLITVFYLTIEFKSLSLAIGNLAEILQQVDPDKIDEEKKKLLKELLDTVFQDLEKWYYEVIEEQSAIDIHYLDASLLSNVQQIKMVIEK